MFDKRYKMNVDRMRERLFFRNLMHYDGQDSSYNFFELYQMFVKLSYHRSCWFQRDDGKHKENDHIKI